MSFVQVTQQTGEVRRVPDEGGPPNDGLIELHLNDNQRVVHVEWKCGYQWSHRKTVDWTWTATIETRC